MVRKTDINGKLVQFAWWALATIVFTLVVTIRNCVMGIPLEHDEGKYAYAGHLILQDIPPSSFWRGNQQTHADSLRLLDRLLLRRRSEITGDLRTTS